MRKGTVMFAFLLTQQNRDFGLGPWLADFLHKHMKTDIHCPWSVCKVCFRLDWPQNKTFTSCVIRCMKSISAEFFESKFSLAYQCVRLCLPSPQKNWMGEKSLVQPFELFPLGNLTCEDDFSVSNLVSFQLVTFLTVVLNFAFCLGCSELFTELDLHHALMWLSFGNL